MLADVWELKHTTFLSQMVTGSQLFPYFTFVHTATFVLLSSFHSQRQIFVRDFCIFLFPLCKDSPQIENKFFSDYQAPKPDLYKRYIDDCAGVTSSSREELLFITSVSFFFLSALECTWEISENSLPFLNIKLSINDNCLSTSAHYKRTVARNYLLHWSFHPHHVKNTIPFSQFLILRRPCSGDSNFNNKCDAMCQFFKKRGYPDSVVTTGKQRAQEIDRETALQNS